MRSGGHRISHQLWIFNPKVIEEKDPGFFLGMSLSQSEDYVFLGCSDHITSETRLSGGTTSIQSPS